MLPTFIRGGGSFGNQTISLLLPLIQFRNNPVSPSTGNYKNTVVQVIIPFPLHFYVQKIYYLRTPPEVFSTNSLHTFLKIFSANFVRKCLLILATIMPIIYCFWGNCIELRACDLLKRFAARFGQDSENCFSQMCVTVFGNNDASAFEAFYNANR